VKPENYKKLFSIPVLKSGFGSICVIFGSVALNSILTWLLARTLSAENFGLYVLSFSIVSLCLILTQLGLPVFVMREVAKFTSQSNWYAIGFILKWATKFSLKAFFLLIVPFLIFSIIESRDFTKTIFIGMFLLPAISLCNIYGGVLKGIKRAALGLLPNLIVRPFVFLSLILLAGLFNYNLNPSLVMAFHLVGGVLGVVCAFVFLSMELPKNVAYLEDNKMPIKSPISSLISLGSLDALHIVAANVGIVILGVFNQTEGAAILRVSIQAATLLSVGTFIINPVISPYLAIAHKDRNLKQFEHFSGIGSLFSSISSVISLVVFLFIGRWLILTLFGTAYEAAYNVILVILVGKLLNSFFASAGVGMSMAGLEKTVAKSVAIGTMMNVIVTTWFAYSFGTIGAAIGLAIGQAFWSCGLWLSARKKMLVDTSALAGIRFLAKLKKNGA
jgi:O-antigen/teichoic acid export membrane protein